jgi:hypothetical protein
MDNNAIKLLLSFVGVLHEVEKECLVWRPRPSVRDIVPTSDYIVFHENPLQDFFFYKSCRACVSFVKMGSITATIY